MRTVSKAGVAAFIVVVIVVILGGTCASTYNKLVRLDQAADAQWAQVENAYQRRADLVPNLVATVKGAAEFERGTLTQIAEARAKVAQVTVPADIAKDPQQFQQFQQAQDQLGAALGRLIAVSEAYPNLTATQNFRDLQAQLEGTENRIAVERMRYNDAAREYNTVRSTFPTSIVASVFGSKFPMRQYFSAKAGSSEPPKVQF